MPSLPVTSTLRFDYEHSDAEALLRRDDALLAVFGFGAACPLPPDARVLRVGLEPIGAAPLEVWRTSGPVHHGHDGDLRWSSGGEHLFFAIEVEEAAHGGIEAAAEYAYQRVARFVSASTQHHLLRLWNYLDAINAGGGDAERYRLFCRGRARSLAASGLRHYPAASAIGRQDGVRVLQVYGLAARHPGTAVENPRQVSAWRYPRQYGPTPPTFARGMRVGARQLLISGTAAVVGHASCHPGDAGAQLDETLANLHSLLREAGLAEPTLGRGSLLKIYLRDAALATLVEARLRERIANAPPMLMLAGDICRRELLLEIDGEHRADGAATESAALQNR
ncbi:hypothetical protein [Ottowia testudinis]|uniref:Chorismatase FkbO/Hyg5-like N-terminal domain-containing protein n=1 Tax=Ottowia testudinis TaxID=2816950 RepID=A0A975CCS8_9BURK|nr:hypothetical protein [Ottowia testudinis]QTD44078.1 hypothetical protein J1M35_13145 [Ottowia testudinis]